MDVEYWFRERTWACSLVAAFLSNLHPGWLRRHDYEVEGWIVGNRLRETKRWITLCAYERGVSGRGVYVVRKEFSWLASFANLKLRSIWDWLRMYRYLLAVYQIAVNIVNDVVNSAINLSFALMIVNLRWNCFYLYEINIVLFKILIINNWTVRSFPIMSFWDTSGQSEQFLLSGSTGEYKVRLALSPLN